MAFAVQLAGAAVPPVIIGTMPVFLAITANIRDRSAPWKALPLPLALIAIGVAIVNAATISTADVGDKSSILLGARQFGGVGDLDRLWSGECGCHAIGRRTGRTAMDRVAGNRCGDRKSTPVAVGFVRTRGHGIRFGNRSLFRMGAGDGAGWLVVCNLVLGGRFPSSAAGARGPTHCS
ncbi:hypothetical protein [Agrobacterium larrymoorei]|uniref:hypothetical protein n=1 Tax=Agrobacterium larrymoorei TaxID=160699 RepID=UPI001F188F7B|nr:hypothetical protein [Agrobacterium larrymoorei]